MTFQKLSPEELRRHKGISFTGITTVFFCHDGKGKLLLNKRSQNTRDEHGRWDPGGGGLKHGEAVEKSLKREILEEYGVRPKAVEFIGYYDAFRTNPEGLPTHWLAMLFAAQVDPTKIKIGEPDMIDAYGWFELNALPKPMHSQFNKIMKQHGTALKQAMGIKS